MPAVVSASASHHPPAPDPRGRAHSAPEHPFAELLDAACGDLSGPKDPPPHAPCAAQARESQGPKDGKPTKEEKAEAKEAKQTEKAESKEARRADKCTCETVEVDGEEVIPPEGDEPAIVGEPAPPAIDLEEAAALDETAPGESVLTTEPATGDEAVPLPLALLDPSPPTPPVIMPEASVTPPVTLPPDLVEAIEQAEPVGSMPPVQPLAATPPTISPPPPETAPAGDPAAAEPTPPELAEAAPPPPTDLNVEASPEATVQANAEAQPRPQLEPAPVLKTATTEPENTDASDVGEQNAQQGATENAPERRGPPPHAVAAGHAKQEAKPDRIRPNDGTAPVGPAQPVAAPPDVAPVNGPHHATGQTYAFLVADTQAIDAPAAQQGIQHGIPAPAVLVPIAGLAIEIAARMQAGHNRFEIRLDPPELGRVDVRLDVDREGHVTSRLVVERAETLDLLRRDAAQLERALQQAGLKTADNSLQFSLRDHSARHGDDNPDRARVIVPDPDLAPAESRIYGRMLGVGGGVDIRV